MATVNLTCVICSEFYKNSDGIVSTSCGHVFHTHCLQEWRMRSTSCPTCRTTFSITYRLYLNFEECSAGSDKEIAEWKSKVEQHIKQSSLLQQQLDQSERDLLKIQEQFCKKNDEIQDLRTKIEYLTLQNETRSKDNEMKTIEIFKLKEALNSANPQASTIMMQEEIKVLKEKNQQISNELSKEIQNGMQLTVDKMRLKNMLEHAKTMATLSTSATTSQATSTRPKNNKSETNRLANNERTKSKRTDRPDSSQSGSIQKNRGCILSVVIKNVKGSFIDEEALKRYVFKLSDLMDLFYSGDDLQQVSVMERKNLDTINLIAKFKNASLKTQFLSRKDRLKLHTDTNHLSLYDFGGDNTNSLFYYARTLKPLGFKHVYCRNNIVYVKKEDGGTPVRITNRGDVDKLKGETSQQTQNSSVDSPLGDIPSHVRRGLDEFLATLSF